VKHLFADAVYDRLKLMDKAAYLDFVVEIIRRSDDQKGFQVLPRQTAGGRFVSLDWRRRIKSFNRRPRPPPRQPPLGRA
jgi:type II secretory pathway component PulK